MSMFARVSCASRFRGAGGMVVRSCVCVVSGQRASMSPRIVVVVVVFVGSFARGGRGAPPGMRELLFLLAGLLVVLLAHVQTTGHVSERALPDEPVQPRSARRRALLVDENAGFGESSEKS